MKVGKMGLVLLTVTVIMCAGVIYILLKYSDPTVAAWRKIGGAITVMLLYGGVWWLAAKVLRGR